MSAAGFAADSAEGRLLTDRGSYLQDRAHRSSPAAIAVPADVEVRIGDRTIGKYDLTGSPAAYRALTHCGSQIASR